MNHGVSILSNAPHCLILYEAYVILCLVVGRILLLLIYAFFASQVK